MADITLQLAEKKTIQIYPPMFKHDTGQLFFTILVIFNIDILVDGQFVGVQESPKLGPGLNKVCQSPFRMLWGNELAIFIIYPGTSSRVRARLTFGLAPHRNLRKFFGTCVHG